MQKHEVYDKFKLYQKLEELNPKFSYRKSISLPFKKFGIIDDEGKYTHCGNFSDFCIQWCNLFGDYIDYSLDKGSFQSGKVFYVKWKNLDTVQEKEEIKQETLPEEKVNVEGEGASLISLSAEDVQVTEYPSVNWEMINSLQNKKYDKEKLDQYAEETFSIKLNRKFTIDNMIAQFKEEIEKLGLQ